MNWIKNEMIFFFYCISELMLATLIHRCDKKNRFKNERLTEILQAPDFMIVLIPYISLLNLSLIINFYFLGIWSP